MRAFLVFTYEMISANIGNIEGRFQIMQWSSFPFESESR